MTRTSVNFDGLVGASHNYSGLAQGNLASARHKAGVSNPRAAALEGLAKMKKLADLGLPQAFLPPPPRPDLGSLRRLGFEGDDRRVINQAARRAPQLLAACYSASAMWSANAATLSASADTADGRVHITPANLIANFHRSLETGFTCQLLRQVFADSRHFQHHQPLPCQALFADEGAANHMRLSALFAGQEQGLNLYIYGRQSLARPHAFPARQSLTASQAIIRQQKVQKALTWQQNPTAVDAGVFHNDVIAVSQDRVLLCHAEAFVGQQQFYRHLHHHFHHADQPLCILEADSRQLSLQQAVASYLYNSQLLRLAPGRLLLLAPEECRQSAAVYAYLQQLVAADNPIRQLAFVDLRQSMQNGGGPACLRLQVPLTDAEQAAVNPVFWLTDERYQQLCDWVTRHYRDRLQPEDLADPQLQEEIQTALAELAGLLGLQALYQADSAADRNQPGNADMYCL